MGDGADDARDQEEWFEFNETLDEFMERVKDEPYPNSVKHMAYATGSSVKECFAAVVRRTP